MRGSFGGGGGGGRPSPYSGLVLPLFVEIVKKIVYLNVLDYWMKELPTAFSWRWRRWI
jgi:hypothetical protein